MADTRSSTSSTAKKNIPIVDILAIRNNNPKLTYEQIGKLVGCSKSNISRRLKEYEQDLAGLQVYKDKRADILALYQKKLLFSLTEDDIKKMPPASRITCTGILYDKERLERDKSTENVSLRGRFHLVADTIKDMIEARRGE